jgi:hypothetical protein
MNLPALTTEQLRLHLREIEEILCLLEKIRPHHLGDVDQEQYKTLSEQADVLYDQSTFEMTRRQLLCQQAHLGTKATPATVLFEHVHQWSDQLQKQLASE